MDEEIPQARDDLLASFSAGSHIATYRLEERIGAGGMAVVFRATDERLGRTVALKVLSPAFAQDADFRLRFIRESRIAASIDDPHIIPLFDAAEAQGVLYIAMRYVPGGDAHSLLESQGPLPAERVVAIISPIASALDAAHAQNLVHRDVKPANMLLDVRADRPDHVYLSDFGLTKNSLSTAGLTATGTILGTIAYSAPEQLNGAAVDGRADQYSLACSAFELINGTVPYPREQFTAAILAHLTDSPPSLSDRVPGIPVAVDHVIAKAMAKTPEARYLSCTDFADSLRAALGFPGYRPGPNASQGQRAAPGVIHQAETVAPGEITPPDSSPPTVPDRDDPGRPSRGRRTKAALAAAAALVVLAGAGVFIANLNRTPLVHHHKHKHSLVASPFASLSGYVTGTGDYITAAVYDRKSNRTFVLNPDPGVTERTAAAVTIEIMGALFREHEIDGARISASDESLLTTMIENSDNQSATSLWDEDGGAKAIQSFDNFSGTTGTIASTDEFIPGSTSLPGWGWTSTTAADQVKLVRDFAYPNKSISSSNRQLGLDLMEHIEAGEDWGVSSGVPSGVTVALKNGWLPIDLTNDTDWQVDSVGWIHGDGRDYVLAVLCQGSGSEEAGINAVDYISRTVYAKI